MSLVHWIDVPVHLHPWVSPRRDPTAHVYERDPERVVFPESEEVPETNKHLEIRTALYVILKREFAGRATIGSEQFIYWDPTTAKKCLAPDAFVRLGAPHAPFGAWKIWERGAPELGVEVISDSDEKESDWSEKLRRYRAAGIRELVRFDPQDKTRPIRIWDAVQGDLIERAVSDPNRHACETLGLWWVVVEHPAIGPMLRLARDREGNDLLLTNDEAELKARQAEADANEANRRLEQELEALRAELKRVKGA